MLKTKQRRYAAEDFIKDFLRNTADSFSTPLFPIHALQVVGEYHT